MHYTHKLKTQNSLTHNSPTYLFPLMKILFLIPAFVAFTLFQTCQPKAKIPEQVPQSFAQESFVQRGDKAGKGMACCNEQESYEPDSAYLGPQFFPAKFVRINFHFMYDGKGENNVPKEIARKKAIDVVKDANHKFRDNCSMNLPLGNNTAEFPVQIQYEITPQSDVPGDDGIYFHDDEELYYYVKRGKNENRPNRAVIEKYGIGLDSILNIFIMPHHPDSVKSKYYKSDVTGIALRNAIKMSGWHANAKTKSWELSKNFNHEVGHILSLRHSWTRNDGCDDTPPHPNCWWYTKNGSHCDSLVSNNVMDYNAGKCAVTPCQIARMHRVLSVEGRLQRNFLKPLHCEFEGWRSMIITDSVHWAGARDVRGNITIAEGGTLMMSCRVSMPPTSTITVMPGAKLILNNNRLHNACGKEWNGIKVYRKGKKKGMVLMNGEPVFENTLSFDLEPVRLPATTPAKKFPGGI